VRASYLNIPPHDIGLNVGRFLTQAWKPTLWVYNSDKSAH